MTSFMERYGAADDDDKEQVWADLVAAGDRIRERPLFEDALEVARETMRRVRINLEMLIPRLVHIGYRFGFEWLQPADHAFDWRQRKIYRDRIKWSHGQTPLLSISTDVEDELDEGRHRLEHLQHLQAPPILLDYWTKKVAELEERPRAPMSLDAFERQVESLPLALRAWYEVVGSVNLVGLHPTWRSLLQEREIADYRMKQHEGIPLFAELEPLHVLPLDRLQVIRDQGSTQATFLAFIPNGATTYGHDGSFAAVNGIALPAKGADATISLGDQRTSFVNYLRLSLRCGGFAGWQRMSARPEEDLAFLTQGMLAF